MIFRRNSEEILIRNVIEFECYLQREDGQFIDEEFYGSEFTTHKKELMEIGVVIYCRTKACSLIASHLKDS